MLLSLPSLELPGIVLVGFICFVVGFLVGGAAMYSTFKKEQRSKF